ncbi:hypothetical protein H6P81_016139 [Aristolochia fimbriata]|uniref:Uncharacterized protein n=1 Tax=Aristolochia fimbriata TaxID=158543 RepID=A0AAV7E7V0_ARIFI|nr:hypothetical protein H6P81_016139 [Aristolochia fimbriata]
MVPDHGGGGGSRGDFGSDGERGEIGDVCQSTGSQSRRAIEIFTRIPRHGRKTIEKTQPAKTEKIPIFYPDNSSDQIETEDEIAAAKRQGIGSRDGLSLL